MSAAYLWFDAEFTSTELETAHFLQVACMATDVNLKRLAPPEKDINLAVRIPDRAPISDWVKKNIPEIVAASLTETASLVVDVDRKLADYVAEFVGPNPKRITERPLIAGNSVHNDWHIARRLLPDFVGRCHYRMLDVTSLKIQWLDHFGGGEEFNKEDLEQVREFFPDLYVPERARTHDAYYDVQASAAELAFLRQAFRG